MRKTGAPSFFPSVMRATMQRSQMSLDVVVEIFDEVQHYLLHQLLRTSELPRGLLLHPNSSPLGLQLQAT